jgi:hypothetical protein
MSQADLRPDLDFQAARREDDAAEHKQGRPPGAPGEALRLQPAPQGVPGVRHGYRNHQQGVTRAAGRSWPPTFATSSVCFEITRENGRLPPCTQFVYLYCCCLRKIFCHVPKVQKSILPPQYSLPCICMGLTHINMY